MHLNHHARYPDPHNDPEAAAAHGGLLAAILAGPFFFIRLWWVGGSQVSVAPIAALARRCDDCELGKAAGDSFRGV